MNQIEALQRLKRLGTPGFETRDAVAALDVTAPNAHMILQRLARAGLVIHVSRGRWLQSADVPPFTLPELISAPYPAYISLQSALFHHGLVEQVPAVIYAVTLGRPRRVRTPFGVVSFHRIPAELFSGFDVEDASGAKIATAEKALFDLLYLAPGRSRLFANLPELEIPRNFQWARLLQYTTLVKSPSRRTYLTERITRLRKMPGMPTYHRGPAAPAGNG
jgi:predicted transcriptional regulator of viral defense system